MFVEPTLPDLPPRPGLVRVPDPETPRPTSAQLLRLHRAVMSLGAGLDLDAVLQRTVEAAAELVDARMGWIVPFVGPQDLHHLEPAAATAAVPPDAPAGADVPVVLGEELWGHLHVADKRDGQPFTAVDEALLDGFATSAAAAIGAAREHARLRRTDLTAERERIAQDLHDSVVKHLFASGFTLQSALSFADTPTEVTTRIEQAIDELDHVITQVRATVFELQASSEVDGGVRRKLLQIGDEVANALGFRPSFTFQGPIDAAVPAAAAPHVLAVVREGLTNVARHAHSREAWVGVEVDGRSLCVLVDDDGIGPGRPRIGGRGLADLGRRAADLGGTCTLEARPEGGSRLRWQIDV